MRSERTAWIRPLAILLGLAAAGCARQPHPPALQRNTGTYQDAKEGFRFDPPAGWTQNLRGTPAPENRSRECQLVKYARAGGRLAFFLVSVIDLAPSTDFNAFLAARSPGKDWHRLSLTETLEVDHLAGVRDVFTGTWDREPVIREIVSVRRGNSVYFFTATFPANDEEVRKQVRQAVASVVWEEEPKS
jgi:hypothetical protein